MKNVNNLISVLIITKNPDIVFVKCLNACKKIANEIVIIDDFSDSKIIQLLKKYDVRLFYNHEKNLGKQREFGLKKCSGPWILSIDSDEVMSDELINEIKNEFKNKDLNSDGYVIPFKNHLFGRILSYGGEDYRMMRLFRKSKGKIESLLLHEYFEIMSKNVKSLKNCIHHYSYRSLPQMYKKFTNYAIRDYEMKRAKGERSSLKKIFMYPAHMFYARFIKDKGYKDGLFRIPLDMGFAYMEFLTYLLLAIKPK